MLLTDALPLVERMIEKDEKHIDYAYVVKMAETYKKLITGKNISALLQQFIKREDAEMFAQRVRLTQIITPAIAAAIKNPFYKVARNKKIAKGVRIGDNEARQKIVADMIDGFYGNPRSNKKGLDYFMASRFTSLSFTDPNAWLVVEWPTPENETVPAKPVPFVVSAASAYNYSVVNDVVQWLLVGFGIKYKTLRGPDTESEADGQKFTLYDADQTIVYEQADRAWLEKNYQLQPGEEIVSLFKGEKTYIRRVFTPNIGFPPAFRIGYSRDPETDERTFVNPFEPAMCYFMKSIKTVSELDLTMTLHAFPQKLQYVQRCPGISREKKCDMGRLVDGTECSNCKGTGYKVHTTAQDAIMLPMPQETTNSEIIDLNKLIAYVSPPGEIINIQREYVKELKQDAMMAVFNSQQFTEMSVAATATEKVLDMDSVYDTLSGFADKFSELWREVVSVMVILSGVQLTDPGVQIIHTFPSDFQLKTKAILFDELGKANLAEAPSFVRDSLTNDIAEIIYSDNELEMQKHNVKRRFYPFNGKSPDEIALATTSEYVPKFDKVLYFNFEKIFAEIERDDKTFWVKPFNKQWEIVGEKVNKIITELEAAAAEAFNAALDLAGANATKTGNNAPAPRPTGNAGTNTGARPAPKPTPVNEQATA